MPISRKINEDKIKSLIFLQKSAEIDQQVKSGKFVLSMKQEQIN
jgi:hypothetical protein